MGIKEKVKYISYPLLRPLLVICMAFVELLDFIILFKQIRNTE